MGNEYKVLIIDDDKPSFTNLKKQLANYFNVTVVGYRNNPIEGAAAITELKPDLLFLDVEMPIKNGFQMLHEISHLIDWPMQVVFHSAYDKYLLEAIRSSAFDFLLKPFASEDLNTIMGRFFDLRSKNVEAKFFQSSFSKVMPSDKSLMISTAIGYQVIQPQQIGYFAYLSKRRVWAVYLTSGSELFLKRNTKSQDILQYNPSFVQISQQYIINIDYLTQINGRLCALCAPFDTVEGLEISRGNLKSIQEKFALI